MDKNVNSFPPAETTEVLYGNDNIIRKTLETFSQVKEHMVGSIDNAGPVIHVIYKPIWNGLVQLKQKGVKIRVVTEVTSNNISYCKKMMEVCELRHLDGLRTNFAIADGKEALLHGVSQENDPLSQAIITSAKALVQAQEYMFENLWKSAIPAQLKIKEIEEGTKPPFIETLRDAVEIQKVGIDIVKSAKQEIQMLLLPNDSRSGNNTFLTQERKQLITELFKVTMLNGIAVRILTSKDMHEQIGKLIEAQKQQEIIAERNYEQEVKDKQGGGRGSIAAAHAKGKLEIRLVDNLLQQQQRLQTKVSILIVDSKICLSEDLKGYSNGPLPLATYSNSESTVLSYTSIFETLWTQTELKA